MRGKKRTQQEKNELFSELERFLSMGFSLKKACSLADLPYSSIRDMTTLYEPLRAKTMALQNTVNVTARANIIRSIEKGDIQSSKWWLERFDHTEPQVSPVYGGEKEMILTYHEAALEVQKGFSHEQLEEMRELADK